MQRLLFVPLMLLLPLLGACARGSDASPEASPSTTASATPTLAQVAVTSTSTPEPAAAALTPTTAPAMPSPTPTPRQASVPATPTAGLVTPPVFARPPAATAAATGASVTMGIGTYCWSAPGSNGICADAAGPVTGAQELVVAPGERIDVTTGFPGSEIREAVASAIAVNTAQGRPIASGELLWNFPPIGGQQLTTTIQPTGVTFAAPTQPGRYVLILFLRPGAGDVAYGVVLDVL